MMSVVCYNDLQILTVCFARFRPAKVYVFYVELGALRHRLQS